MKRPLLHLLIAGAAATAGWYSGSTESVDEAQGPAPRREAPPAAKATGPAATRWVAKLNVVRAVPGAASEIAWIKWAMSIPDADIPAALARLNPKSDFHALRFLYARWVKLDAPAAWASFRKSDIPARVSHFYLSERRGNSGMVSSSLQEDPRSMIAARMLASWMTVDPVAARAFGAKLAVKGSPEAKDVPIHAYYLKDALGDDPDKVAPSPEQLAAAATEALKREAGNERTGVIADAVRQWMAADANAACEWLRALPIEDRKDLWRYSFSGSMRGVPPALRTAAHMALLEGQGTTSGHLAAAQAPNQDSVIDPQRQSLHDTSAAIRDWITEDTAGAKQWLAAQPDGELKSLLAGEAAAALVQKDVNGAIALLNETGGDQGFALRSFVNGWTATDARAALSWAEKIPDAEARDTCLGSAALSLTASDPALALTTAGGLTDEAARRFVFAAVRQSLSWNPAALENMRAQFPGDDWNEGVRPPRR